MNKKQRARKLERRRNPNSYTNLTPAMQAYNEVLAKAKQQKKGQSFILTQMQKRHYLPDGNGRWRAMTSNEQTMWR